MNKQQHPKTLRTVAVVHFIHDAVLDFVPVNKAAASHFVIEVTELMVFFSSRNSGKQFCVPMSNVRTVSFA